VVSLASIPDFTARHLAVILHWCLSGQLVLKSAEEEEDESDDDDVDDVDDASPCHHASSSSLFQSISCLTHHDHSGHGTPTPPQQQQQQQQQERPEDLCFALLHWADYFDMQQLTRELEAVMTRLVQDPDTVLGIWLTAAATLAEQQQQEDESALPSDDDDDTSSVSSRTQQQQQQQQPAFTLAAGRHYPSTASSLHSISFNSKWTASSSSSSRNGGRAAAAGVQLSPYEHIGDEARRFVCDNFLLMTAPDRLAALYRCLSPAMLKQCLDGGAIAADTRYMLDVVEHYCWYRAEREAAAAAAGGGNGASTTSAATSTTIPTFFPSDEEEEEEDDEDDDGLFDQIPLWHTVDSGGVGDDAAPATVTASSSSHSLRWHAAIATQGSSSGSASGRFATAYERQHRVCMPEYSASSVSPPVDPFRLSKSEVPTKEKQKKKKKKKKQQQSRTAAILDYNHHQPAHYEAQQKQKRERALRQRYLALRQSLTPPSVLFNARTRHGLVGQQPWAGRMAGAGGGGGGHHLPNWAR
jgi:hypothetical protein